MSAPTQQFQRLTIGGGMTALTRSAAQRQRRERERNERQQAAATRATHDATLASRTGLQYDMRLLSDEANRTARRALLSEKFMLKFSRRVDQTERLGYYLAFELKESASVRIFDTGRPERQISCTCEEYGIAYAGRNYEPAPPCVHIYWLYDGLNHALGTVPENALLPLDRASIERRCLELFNDIETLIDDLPDRLNLAENPNSEDEDASEQKDLEIRDMLAVFRPDQLWDEFDDDFLSLHPVSEEFQYEDLVVVGDLQATVSSLARHDPIFRSRLRNAVTHDVCIRDFFVKLNGRSRSIFERFDDYRRRGPRLDPRFVNTCGSRLREIMSKMSAYSKRFETPLDPDFSEEFVTLTLRILDEVRVRNRDIYKDSPWHTTEDEPEDERNCNLFANLISDPDSSYQDSLFTLDIPYGDLSPTVLPGLIDRLIGLRQKLRQQGPPSRFLDEMTNLIASLQAIRSHDEDSDEDPEEGPSGSASGENLPRSRERRPTLEERHDPHQRRRLE